MRFLIVALLAAISYAQTEHEMSHVINETLASYFSRLTNEFIEPTNVTNLVRETPQSQEQDQSIELMTWIIICVLTFFCGLVTAMALRFRSSSFSFSKSITITSISFPAPQGPDSPPPHISHTTSESLHHSSRENNPSSKVFLKSSSDSVNGMDESSPDLIGHMTASAAATGRSSAVSWTKRFLSKEGLTNIKARESVRKRYQTEYRKSQSCRESVVDPSRRKSGFVDQNNASVRRSAYLHQAPSLQRLGSPRQNGTSPRQKFGSDFTKQTLTSPKAGFNKFGSPNSPKQRKVTRVKDKPLLYE